MITIRERTLIEAPIEHCFRLSLSIDLEAQAVSRYGTQAIAGVTSGIIQKGDRVTWKSKQFGLWITHETEISKLDEPTYFQDRMVKGLFRCFCHDHFFRSVGVNVTEMRDELSYSMPAFLFGCFTERLVVRRRMSALLKDRNALIKQTAEAQ